MNIALIALIGLVLSLPICILWMAVRLFMTRNDGRAGAGERAPAWSSGVYSGCKRAALAWVAEMVFCAVAYAGFGFYDVRILPANCHFLLMVAIPFAAFAWGMLRPRVYTDGVERVRNGRGVCWAVLAVLLFFLFAPVFYVARLVVPFRHVDSETGMIEIRAAEWDAWSFRMAPVAANMVPDGAKDIEFSFMPPVFMGLGGRAELRCKVGKDALLAFAKSKGYEFQSESVGRNACESGPEDCDFIHSLWGKYNREPSGEALYSSPDGMAFSYRKVAPDWKEVADFKWRTLPYPKDFLAYNYRYASCGGYSFFYDVAAETLYADWSSN